MDFTIIVRSGLSLQEVGEILDVSRVTVYKYTRGAQPRASRLARTQATLRVLERLVERGQLPLKDVNKFSINEQIRDKRQSTVAKIKAHIDAALATTPANT